MTVQRIPSVAKLALVSIVFSSLASGPVWAGPIDVFVGYSDNLRASGFFPSPWLGAPGVVSETPSGQSFDAGAVRVDNNSGASITISNFQVNVSGTPTFSIWSSLVIPNGNSGIFTQTSSYNFDSSDFGVFGALSPDSIAPNNYLGNGNTNLIGGCSSSAALLALNGYTATCAATIPVVSFEVDGGAAQAFSDTGHILDTGQWDFVNNTVYGEDGNESINWNLIGSGAVRGGTVPEPATISLLGVGLAGLAATRRRRKSKSKA